MTLTGPQKYPPASTAYWYGGKYPGSAMESNVAVWHTTEGRTLPGYDGGAVAPNLTAVPDIASRKLKWYQHFDIDRSSRALVNSSGGVETNTANAVQIELVGTCAPATRDSWNKAGYQFIYWPDAPAWALAEVAKFVSWLHDNHGVRAESRVTWKAYPGSYGTDNGVRLSGAAWGAYYGHLGHQHVPENLHGDPGAIDFNRIIELALGGVDVALTTDDIKKIFGTDEIIPSPDNATSTNKFWTLASYQRETYLKAQAGAADAAAARGAVGAVGKQVADLGKKVDSLATGGVDLDALAKKVADLLAARLVD